MKDIITYILESNSNEFTLNISQISSGKRNDMLLFKKILKSLELKRDTNIDVDCGKFGLCEISYTNFKNNICGINIRLKNLGKYIKFSQEVDSEWSDNGTIEDLYKKMNNILKKLKDELL